MILIHSTLGRSKKRKPSAKQRELQQSWDHMMKKYPTKMVIQKDQPLSDVYSLAKSACRETPKIASLPFTAEPCFKKPSPIYTGTMVKGIGTMHKSNAVPIFSDEEAVAIATMRR